VAIEELRFLHNLFGLLLLWKLSLEDVNLAHTYAASFRLIKAPFLSGFGTQASTIPALFFLGCPHILGTTVPLNDNI